MSNLSRRKHNEATVHLGEPLPLLYQVVLPSPKDDDTTVVENRYIAQIPKPILLKSRTRLPKSEDNRFESRSVAKSSSSLSRADKQPNERLQISVQNDKISKLLVSIESKIAQLKTLLLSHEDIAIADEEIEFFDGYLSGVIGSMVRPHERTNEVPKDEEEITILDELARIQTESRNYSKRIYVSVAVCLSIIAFFITSFIMSGLNYEYCYYLC